MARASLDFGVAQLKDEWPPLVFVVGDLVPEVIRAMVLCLVGLVVGGEAGLLFAWVGNVVLVIASTCIAHTSDIPAVDAREGVIGTLSTAPLSLLAQYVLRALPLTVLAAIKLVVCAVMLGVVFGFTSLVPSVLLASWVTLPALVSCAMLSFALLATTLGTGWEHLSYNLATAVVTVSAGAIIDLQGLPLLDAVGSFLPLHHAVDAMRLLVDADPDPAAALLAVARETAVAIGWAIVAWAAFALRIRAGRATGRGGLDG